MCGTECGVSLLCGLYFGLRVGVLQVVVWLFLMSLWIYDLFVCIDALYCYGLFDLGC